MNSSLFDISSYISVHPISLNVAIAIFFAIALLLLSALRVHLRLAFFSLSPVDVDALEPDKRPSDKLVQELRDDNERTLATILITNNLVNVAIIMLCNYIFDSLLTFGVKMVAVLVCNNSVDISFVAFW